MIEVIYKRILEVMAKPDLFDIFLIKLSVPIEAEASIGPWGAGVDLEKWKATQRPLARPEPRRRAPVARRLAEKRRAM